MNQEHYVLTMHSTQKMELCVLVDEADVGLREARVWSEDFRGKLCCRRALLSG